MGNEPPLRSSEDATKSLLGVASILLDVLPKNCLKLDYESLILLDSVTEKVKISLT